MVLIRSNRDEGCLMKDMSTVSSVFGSKDVVFIGFDYVQSGLVFVHRVQNDLGGQREGKNISFLTSYSNGLLTASMVRYIFFHHWLIKKNINCLNR